MGADPEHELVITADRKHQKKTKKNGIRLAKSIIDHTARRVSSDAVSSWEKHDERLQMTPKCSYTDTVSPFGLTRTQSVTTSASRNEGQPCSLLSATKSAQLLAPRGTTKAGRPETESQNVSVAPLSAIAADSVRKVVAGEAKKPEGSAASPRLRQHSRAASLLLHPHRRSGCGGAAVEPWAFSDTTESSALIA